MINLKKLSFGAALVLCSTGAAMADNIVITTPANFKVLAVSPNGKWACGGILDLSNSEVTYAFRWNLESDKVEILSTEISLAFDIADDGTVSGEFQDKNALPNGAPLNLPGVWANGSWHSLEMPDGNISDGLAGCITPDGSAMTGTLCVDGIYRPYIWKNYKLHRELPVNGANAVAYPISPDGNTAAGFITRYNRTACIWKPDGDIIYLDDSTVLPESAWNYCRNYSPDGSKLLYWGGWKVEDEQMVGLYAIYDVETGERLTVPMTEEEIEMEFYDIANDGTLVGTSDGRAIIYNGEQTYFLDDYFPLIDVDLSNFGDFYDMGGTYPFESAASISADGKVIALNYYNSKGMINGMVLKLDVDPWQALPADVKAYKMDGINNVAVKWNVPAGITSLRGYNVYRDGTKISGRLPINRLEFYDKNLADGTYTYTVAAVNTLGDENFSEPVTVTVSPEKKNAPINLQARQKGANGAMFTWEAPFSGAAHVRYYNPETRDFTGLYIYDPVDMETGVRFTKAELENYSGHKIKEVSFVPMSPQVEWFANVYSIDDQEELTLLASKSAEDDLKYGERNTIVFDEPVDLPATDIIVAIEVRTQGNGRMTVGAEAGNNIAGYTDLLRQISDPAFFSTYEATLEAGTGITSVAWAIDLGLVANGAEDSALYPAKYEVTVDNEKVGETDSRLYVVKGLDEGTHTLGVNALFPDNETSAVSSLPIEIVEAYPAVDKVNVATSGTTVNASWEAPADNDKTSISYTVAETSDRGIRGTANNDYEYTAAAIYSAEMLKGYEGYRIKSVKFFPLNDADFHIFVGDNYSALFDTVVTDYVLGEWNEVVIPDDIIITPQTEYMLAVGCKNPTPEKNILAIDNLTPIPYYSDLFAIGDGETWMSLNVETAADGSWMLGMVIEDPLAEGIDVDGYDVVIDNVAKNDTKVADTAFSYSFPDDTATSNHSIRIDTYYTARSQAVEGGVTYFIIDPSGIESAVAIAAIKLVKGDNYLVAECDSVDSIAIYSISGAKVAEAKGNKVEIGNLASGVYAVQIKAGAKAITRKVSITR